MVIFVFYCYTANHHKFSSLKQHWYISSKFCPSEVWTQDDWFLLLRVSPGWNQGWGGLCSHLEARLRKNLIPDLHFWQNPVLWAEVPAFLLLTRSCSQLWTLLTFSHPVTTFVFKASSEELPLYQISYSETPQELLSLFNVSPDYIWHIDNNQSQLIRNLDFCFSLSFF